MITKDPLPIGLAAMPEKEPVPDHKDRLSDRRLSLPNVQAPVFLLTVRKLWRRRWLIALVTLLGVVIATLLGLRSVPQYRSEAMVLVIAPSGRVEQSPNVVPAVAVEHGTVETESRVIASRANVVRALARLDQDPARAAGGQGCAAEGSWDRIVRRLKDTVGLPIVSDCKPARVSAQDSSPDAEDRQVSTILRRLQSAPNGQSALVSLAYASDDPQEARSFLDALIISYLDEQLAEKRDMIARLQQFHDTRISELSARINKLKEAIAAQDADPALSSASDGDQADLSRSLDLLRSELDSQTTERGRLNDVSALLLPDARIVSPASPAANASPSVATYGVLGFVGFLVAGCMLALVLDRFDRTLRNEEELERLSGVPCFGLIPEFGPRSGLASDSDRDDPNSAYANAVRMLLATLPLERSKVVVITSSLPGEGCTTLATGLVSMAAGGRRVLRVSLGDQNGAGQNSNGRGSSIDSKGLGSLSQVAGMIISHSAAEGRDFLRPSPGHQSNPGNALAVKDALPRLRSEYDLILIDAPAVFASADAVHLAAAADVVLLVVRWGRTDRRAVRRSLERLSAASSLATVLTRVNMRRHRQYGFCDALSVPAISRGNNV